MVVRGAEYPRQSHDWYTTPAPPIRALFKAVQFNRRLCDPCCGNGSMMNVFQECGYQALGFDVSPWGNFMRRDFLTEPFPWPENDGWRGSPDIVTNPPYGTQGILARKFAERALSITSVWKGKVALLLRIDYDSGKTRKHLFRDCPAFKHKVVLLDRIEWFADQSGEQNHAWYVWDWLNRDRPTIIYV